MEKLPLNLNGTFAPSLVDDLLATFERTAPVFTRASTSNNNISGMLAIDVEESEDAYLITANAPGVQKDWIDITVSRDKLVLSLKPQVNASEPSRENEDKKRYLHRERAMCAISRTFALPNVSAENVEAHLKDGVLEIKVRKDEARLPKRITIS